MKGMMRMTRTTVHEVKELTEKVIAAWTETGAHEAHEDFADAFHSIGQLWQGVGAEMLYNVYKDDKDQSVVEHMTMVLHQAHDDNNEALTTLAQFGIRPTTIDDI